MNSHFIVQQSRQLALRLQREAGDDRDAQIRLAWRLCFAASPTADELADAQSFLDEQLHHFADQPIDATASFCQALLSSNRFLYID